MPEIKFVEEALRVALAQRARENLNPLFQKVGEMVKELPYAPGASLSRSWEVRKLLLETLQGEVESLFQSQIEKAAVEVRYFS